MKPIRFENFLGMNTKLPDYGLTSTDRRNPGRWVRDAINIDFRNDGSFARRRAFSLVPSTAGAHSVFEDLLVRDSVLYRFTTGPYSQTFVSLLSTNSPMSYCRVGDNIYLSNGTDSFRMRSNGEIVPWAVSAPDAPEVVATSGDLPNGRYGVQLSFCMCDEEGILSEITWVETDETLAGGFRVTIPSAPMWVEKINVYITGNDGAAPMLYASVDPGDTTCDIVSQPYGQEAHTRIESPLPAGKLFEYNGRLCSVVGRRIWFSVPYKAGYCEAASGYVEFESDVKIAIGNQAGVYVAATKTHFLAGQDIATAELVRDVLNYSAVPGTEFSHPTKPLVGWFGAEGIVLGAADGSVEELMEEKVRVTPPASGCSFVQTGYELTLVTSCGWTVNLDTGAVSRYDSVFSSATGAVLCNALGVYTFGTGPVDALFDLGREDFKTEVEKGMPTAYIGSASDGPLSLTVVAADQVYSYEARSYSTSLNVERFEVGKGLRANWFELAVTNPEGVDFEVTSIHFAPVADSRRI